jgi:hypothetical protein
MLIERRFNLIRNDADLMQLRPAQHDAAHG